MKQFFSHNHERRLAPFVDTLIYLGGLAGPIVTIPQAVQIFVEHDASGVSLFSWGAYLIGAGVWFIYGLIHREKPIIFFNILNIPIYAAVVVGILMYR